jgi:hypothetical protein
MKKRIILVLIVTIINISLFAQNKKDSARFYKNEVGVSLIPLFTINNQSNKYAPTINVFYKRSIKNNWYARASLIYFGNYNDGQIHIEKIKGLPNSKLGINYAQNFTYDYFQYNLGFEKRFGKEKLKMFSGLDVGYANQKAEDFKMYAIRDSITNNSVGYDPKTGNMQGAKLDSTVFHHKSTTNSIIFTPFYGVQISISKHFLFSAQLGVALSVEKQSNNRITDNNPKDYYPSNITNFDLNLNGASSNFSICYRF